MEYKYARTIGALNTAAKLAKDPNTQDEAFEFIRQNPTYFPTLIPMLNSKVETKSSKNIPNLVPLNLKNSTIAKP